MSRALLPSPARQELAESGATLIRARLGRLDWRCFPDGGSLVAVDEAIDGASVTVVGRLYQPDEMTLALPFAAASAREFGARRAGLVAPGQPGTRVARGDPPPTLHIDARGEPDVALAYYVRHADRLQWESFE